MITSSGDGSANGPARALCVSELVAEAVTLDMQPKRHSYHAKRLDSDQARRAASGRNS
jgi:hypothetical protein